MCDGYKRDYVEDWYMTKSSKVDNSKATDAAVSLNTKNQVCPEALALPGDSLAHESTFSKQTWYQHFCIGTYPSLPSLQKITEWRVSIPTVEKP